MSETVKYRGRTITIDQDETPMNPRVDFDNLGTMVCFHSRYNLGDENTGHDNDEDFKDYLNSDEVVLVLPLFLYDHLGITMSTGAFGCKWDSGQVGVIFITKEQLDSEDCNWSKEWIDKYHKGKSKEDILKVILEGEVETYDQFLTGEIYGYDTGEDSCWGYFGSDHEKSGLMEAAKNAIDCEINYKIKKKLAKLKEYIKAKVPMIYRTLPIIS